jgi:hypothetical protein
VALLPERTLKPLSTGRNRPVEGTARQGHVVFFTKILISERKLVLASVAECAKVFVPGSPALPLQAAIVSAISRPS